MQADMVLHCLHMAYKPVPACKEWSKRSIKKLMKLFEAFFFRYNFISNTSDKMLHVYHLATKGRNEVQNVVELATKPMYLFPPTPSWYQADTCILEAVLNPWFMKLQISADL